LYKSLVLLCFAVKVLNSKQMEDAFLKSETINLPMHGLTVLSRQALVQSSSCSMARSKRLMI